MTLKSALLTAPLMAMSVIASTPVSASSHREAPAITETPKVDGTDLYMFRSYEPGRDGFVTFISNYQPLQAPYGGPNYFTMDPDALYEIHIDVDGDALEDLTFQFDFNNDLVNDTGVTLNIDGEEVPIALRYAGAVTGPNAATLGETEEYDLYVVTGDRRTGERTLVGTFQKPLDNVGTNTVPDYDLYADQFVFDFTIPGCSTPARVFVGQRAEAFAVNLGAVFDLVNLVPIDGDVPLDASGFTFPGGITQDRANDDVVDEFNVTSLAIEAPISCLNDDGDNIIGGWMTASLPQASIEDPTPTFEQPAAHGGGFVQRSRLSNPLVNELVIGLNQKDMFNASEPAFDTQFLTFVTNPTFPAIIDILFRDAVNQTLGTDITSLAPSNAGRDDLVAAFLTGIATLNQPADGTPSEMQRLNFSIAPTPQASQSALGVAGDDLAGFPNGRRPGDDVVDIVLRVALGALCHPVPINGTPTDLGLCTPEDAPVGTVPFTDGAPISASELQNEFPYLNNPIPGATGQ